MNTHRMSFLAAIQLVALLSSNLPHLLCLSQPIHYTHDGIGNNPNHPSWGSANQPRIRTHPPLNSYTDEMSTPRTDLPSARRVLTELFQNSPIHGNKKASQLLLYFGQLIVHDITRSISYPPERTEESMPITCDGVEHRGRFCGEGVGEMPFQRTQRDVAEGNNHGPAASINFATAFLDLDNVYGPNIGGPPESQYRKFSGGKMMLDETSGLPPRDKETGRYITADPRSRAGPVILSLVTVFLRYHNLRAQAYYQMKPNATDEELYQAAKMDTITAYQNIVEEKYIPTSLGETLGPYVGYNNKTNPSIDIFFSTCSFRYGHAGLSGTQRMLNKEFRPTAYDPVLLRDSHGNTEQILDRLALDRNLGSVAADLLRGLAVEPAKPSDASFVDDVSLFTGAMAVVNIQRGRDSGLPSYNEAREWFNLTRKSMDEIAGGNKKVAESLRILYGEDGADDVDAYIGGLLEAHTSSNNDLGPLMSASIKEQFTRLRNGDRFWYKARLTPEEIERLPSLSDMIKITFGEDEMKYFPEDSFKAVDQLAIGVAGQGEETEGSSSLTFLDGVYTVSWSLSEEAGARSIDVTLNVAELVQGGFLGIGWGGQSMAGSLIWFCTAVDNVELSQKCQSSPESSPRSSDSKVDTDSPMDRSPAFSCCVAPGESHVKPECASQGDDSYYPLYVIDSCQSQASSFVTVRADVCPSDSEVNNDCFYIPKGGIDFIIAYNPSSSVQPHGFSRRTMGQMNLMSGSGSAAGSDSANAGMFALHGATLLFCWLVLVPIAIYIVRYMKGKPWRISAHITLVGTATSLVLALAMAAFASVEGTSFGTVDAESAQMSDHKAAGLSIVGVVLFMVMTGELRRSRSVTEKIRSRKFELAVIYSHRCVGLALVGLSWWNCYTGLIQIEPYSADDVEVTWLGSRTTALGYDLESFGFFRKYIFIPYVSMVCLIFLITEVRMRRSVGSTHSERLKAVRNGADTLWGSDPIDDKNIQTMSIESFLDMTRNGGAFCIAGGYVLDIGSFIDFHPGGMRVLRFAIGSDITEYLFGGEEVDGVRHMHSPVAFRTLRTLIKAKLDVPASAADQRLANCQALCSTLVFRDARIDNIQYVSSEWSLESKSVLRIELALKRLNGLDDLVGTPLPSTTIIFRGKDSFGAIIERPYTPMKCYIRSDANVTNSPSPCLPRVVMKRHPSPQRKEEIVYEFFISILPEGKMSSFLRNKKPGTHLMVLGPLTNETDLEKLGSQVWADIVLIAQGTGISTMLQLVDHFLDCFGTQSSPTSKSTEGTSSEPPKFDDKPNVFLAWLLPSESRSYTDAAQLEQRSKVTHGKFKYFIIDRDDPVTSTVFPDEPQQPKKRSTFASAWNNEFPWKKPKLRKKSGNSIQFARSGPSSMHEGLSQEESQIEHEGTEDFRSAKQYFLKQYRSKGKLDKELIATLLPLATGTEISPPLNDALERKVYENTLVAVCGSPSFEMSSITALEELGLTSKQIINFHIGTAPLHLARPVSEGTSGGCSEMAEEHLGLGSRRSLFGENSASSQRDIDALEPTTDALGKSVDANERNRNRGKLAKVIAEDHESKRTCCRTVATATTADNTADTASSDLV